MSPISVHQAALELQERDLLVRERKPHPARVIEYVENLIQRALPDDLVDFYREGIFSIDAFGAEVPIWNDYVGWRSSDEVVTRLLGANAIPIFNDGCGSLFGLDLTLGVEKPAVYFFDHSDGFEKPQWAAGSSLGVFLLLLGDRYRAFDEGWPPRWELKIDHDIDKCPRAPAIWNAG